MLQLDEKPFFFEVSMKDVLTECPKGATHCCLAWTQKKSGVTKRGEWSPIEEERFKANMAKDQNIAYKDFATYFVGYRVDNKTGGGKTK